MVSTYSAFKNLTSSEKNILAWVHGNQRVFNFTNVSGTIYKKTMSYYVVAVENDGTALTDGGDTTPDSGEFYFDTTTKELYINIGEDPTGNFIAVTYRLFFSDSGQNLSYDLDSGQVVHYEPLLDSSSKFSTQLDGDVDQLGFASVGSGSLKLINTGSYFDDIYDLIQFENGDVQIFSTGESIPNSEIQTIYRGKIDSKSYSDTYVTFKLKDPLTVLTELVPLNLYSSSDGDLSETDIGTAKRRIYGEVDGARCVGISKILDGFALTGTFTASVASTTVTGSGSSLLSELSPGDTVKYAGVEDTLELTVKTVDSDTQFTVEDGLEEAMTAATVTNLPQRGVRIKNRNWRICGHILKEPATTVVSGTSETRFTVSSAADLFAGDIIAVNGERKQIRRISGSTIVLETALSFTPSASQTVVKSPVQAVYLGSKLLSFSTDYSLTNTSEATIVLNALAEVNVTPPRTGLGTVSISNGSRTLTGVGTDFVRDLRPRDYISITGVSGSFEVLQIDSETHVQMAASWSEVTQSSKTYKIKSVEYANDDSIVTVQCLGITEDGTKTGTWINTAAGIAKHLLTEAGESANLNTSSFSTASTDAPQRISIKVPLRFGDQEESIKEVINVANKSVFGSLVLDNDYKFKYSVLTPKKPADALSLMDDDILSWDVKTDSRKILNKVIVNYKFKDADPITGEESNSVYEKTSTFVDRLIKTNRSETFDVHLFLSSEADIIAQRYRFIRELSSSIVVLKSKLNLVDKELNDVIYFELDRLFKRYGSNDATKIGIINRIQKDAFSTLVEVNDLSGWYNRVCTICPNTATVYSSASTTAKNRAFNGYIVDNNDNLANSSNPESFGANLIG